MILPSLIYLLEISKNRCKYNSCSIMDAIATFEKFNLKYPPIVYKGKLNAFLSNFDVEKFTSIVSFYGLFYIHSDKGTEGVTITECLSTIKDEDIVLKYKQSWAVENRRVFDKKPKVYNNVNEVESLCLDMMNYI